MSTKFLREVALLIPRTKCCHSISHLIGILYSQVSQSPKSLYRDEIAGGDLKFPDRVENCDASTENWGIFDWIDVFRDIDYCLLSQEYVFRVSSVFSDAVCGYVLAHLELAALALLADPIVSPMP